MRLVKATMQEEDWYKWCRKNVFNWPVKLLICIEDIKVILLMCFCQYCEGAEAAKYRWNPEQCGLSAILHFYNKTHSHFQSCQEEKFSFLSSLPPPPAKKTNKKLTKNQQQQNQKQQVLSLNGQHNRGTQFKMPHKEHCFLFCAQFWNWWSF